MKNLGCKGLGSGCGAQGLGFRDQGSGSKVHVWGLKVRGEV